MSIFLSQIYLAPHTPHPLLPPPLLPPKQESTAKRIVHVNFFFGGGEGENKVVGYIYERLNHIL